MTTTRLTQPIRDALLKKLITRAFQERAQDLVDRCSAFAVEVYEDALADHLELIRSLPRGWLPSDNDLKVMMTSDMARLCFNGSLGNGTIDTVLRNAGAKDAEPAVPGSQSGSFGRIELPFPAKMKGQCLKQYPAGHPLAERYTALCHELADLKTEMERASRTASAAMNSVTTVKKLIEVWPEVEAFAKHYLDNGDRKAILPAIPRADLNAQLGLPPAERVEEAA